MIQDLLWRCPVCATNDALRHTSHWFRPDRLDCISCGAQWRVRRVVGDNYYLKIHRPGANAAVYPAGFELSITGWYDVMKTSLRLEAPPGAADTQEAKESLYLVSGPATLWAEKEGDISSPPISDGGFIGTGILTLSNTRLFWRKTAQEGHTENETISWPLEKVDGISTVLNLGLFLAAGRQLYVFRFAQESPLKWVTYMALLAPAVFSGYGHRIHTSHF